MAKRIERFLEATGVAALFIELSSAVSNEPVAFRNMRFQYREAILSLREP